MKGIKLFKNNYNLRVQVFEIDTTVINEDIEIWKIIQKLKKIMQ